MSCARPRPTRNVYNSGYGAKAWCPDCRDWLPAVQVPFGQERKNAAGKITASYAPIVHQSKEN